MRIGSLRGDEGRRLPSAGTLLGLTALTVAMAGTAVALPGKNTVNSGDIKNNAVKGADVKESTLGTVPEAASLAGTELSSFQEQVALNNPSEFVTVGGVEVEVNCLDGSPQATVRNVSGQEASLVVSGIRGGDAEFVVGDADFTSEDFDPLTTFDETDTHGQSTTQVAFADGSVTAIDLAWNNEDIGGGGDVCSYWGRVTSG